MSSSGEAARENESRELPQRHVEDEIPKSSLPTIRYLLRRSRAVLLKCIHYHRNCLRLPDNLATEISIVVLGSRRVLMILSVVFIVAPLCLVEKMRQLKVFATVGTSIVIWLLVVIVMDAIRFKLPAVKNGELAAVGFTSAQAISTFGFAPDDDALHACW
ncbi:hypothetical protein SELMODRAFT_444153 [Selaginella moellendorffii]|uniref:Uncharacterized protein n=1 Tax=Selaginella moellendorffii TaxID=88036 RepID=D8S7E4_SELML|nr:hypothetical protein SELMODRAFT_444153 [Selaginella moellendorffii]